MAILLLGGTITPVLGQSSPELKIVINEVELNPTGPDSGLGLSSDPITSYKLLSSPSIRGASIETCLPVFFKDCCTSYNDLNNCKPLLEYYVSCMSNNTKF